MHSRRYRPEYTMPAVDSPRAIAAATMILTGARSIDHLTIEGFAHQQRLKPKTAEYLIGREKKRRADRGE